MKKVTLLSIFALCTFLSCNDDGNDSAKNNELPPNTKSIDEVCYTLTSSIELAFRKNPSIEGQLIERIPQREEVVILEKNVAVSDGFIWHKVRWNGKKGYVAPLVYCDVTIIYDETQRHNHDLILRLVDEALTEAPEPQGKTNQELIHKWERYYSSEDFYQGPLRRGWHRLNEGNRLKIIAECSQKYGVPFDLAVFLMLTESSCYPHRNNHAGAGGYWQFIPSTGREWGLVINDRVDERLDFEKSTDAAMRYLVHLRNQVHRWHGGTSSELDRWHFAAASYNRGATKVRRTYKACNGKYFYYPTKVSHKFWETRNYVPKIYGARRWIQKYAQEDYVGIIHKTPADLAFEGYRERQAKLDHDECLEMLEIIESMYAAEVRDLDYKEGALSVVRGEIRAIKQAR